MYTSITCISQEHTDSLRWRYPGEEPVVKTRQKAKQNKGVVRRNLEEGVTTANEIRVVQRPCQSESATKDAGTI